MWSPDDLKTWQDLVKLLQDANSSDQATLQLHHLCTGLEGGFTFSKATHKRLLAKEVPRRLAAAFVKHAQHGAWRACNSADLIIALQDLVTCLLSGRSHQGSTVLTLRQQLHQAGLWEALPGILSAAAQDLETSAGHIADLQACSMYRDSGDPMPCCALYQLLVYMVRLVDLLGVIGGEQLWGGTSLLQSQLANSAEPAMHLAAAAVQFICSYQEQRHEDVVPDVARGLKDLFGRTGTALNSVLCMVAAQSDAAASGGCAASSITAGRATAQQQRQLVQQLLLSPHWRRVTGFWLMAHNYALLRCKEYPGTCSRGDACSSGNSPSSRGSSSSIRTDSVSGTAGGDRTLPSGVRCSSGGSSSSGSSSGGGGGSGCCCCGSSSGCGSRSGGGSSNSGDNSSGGGSSSCGVSGVSGSSTGSNRSSSGETEIVWAQGMCTDADTITYSRAAAFAADWHDELPASHQQLLELLGYNSKGVLWVAGLLSEYGWQGDVMELLGSVHTSASFWVRECASQQLQAGEQSAGTVAGTANAAADVLLASVLLHCAAHYPSCTQSMSPETQCHQYLSLCGAATRFAFSAWSGPVGEAYSTHSQDRFDAVPIENLQAFLAEAQQLAAAEQEHAFFLQHTLSGVLRLLREHPVCLQAADTPVAVARCESGSSVSRLSSGDPSSSSSSSRPSQPAIEAVQDAVKVLALVCGHYGKRHKLQSRLAAAGHNCRGEGSSAAAAGARLRLGADLAACLQDCVRLGATFEQAQPPWSTVICLCTPNGANIDQNSPVLAALTAPPGSPQQQQLFGLMCSLLKSVQLVGAGAKQHSRQFEDALPSIVGIAGFAVAAITMQRQRKATSAHAVGGDAGSRGSVQRNAAAAATAGTRTPSQAASTAATAVPGAAAAAVPYAMCGSTNRAVLLHVPWLVLFGCCCLIMAQCTKCSADAAMNRLPGWLSALQSWLQGSRASAQLAAPGLNPGGLLQALLDTNTALQHMQDKTSGGGAGGGTSTDARQMPDQSLSSAPCSAVSAAAADSVGGGEAKQFAGRLHALGVSLSSLPMSWGCNNPLCTNMQGRAEAGIVQGKGHKCNGCHKAYYCGKACQAQHWKQHKPVCKAVAAAAAAGAVAARP